MMSDTHELEMRFWSAFGGILYGQPRKPQTADEWIQAGKQLRGLSNLEAIVNRLEKSTQPVQQPPKRRNIAQDGDVYYDSDGQACCPTHERPLKEGKWGFYCSAKDERGKNGYCDFRTKGV